MKGLRLARLLLAAGALQFVAVGCGDDGVVGGRDSGPDVVEKDNPIPEDNPAPEDRQMPPEDRQTPEDRQVPPEDRPMPPMDSGDDVQMPPDVVVKLDVPDAGPPPDDTVIVEDTPDVPVTPDAPADVAADVAPDGPTVECRASADCMGSMNGPVCDTATNRCVPCTTAEDVCSVGNYCNMNRCVPGCRNAMDCSMGNRCDVATHTCVGCTGDADCALGTICRMNTCVPGCGPGRACGAGSTCCGTACVNAQTDNMNCGMCGRACATGTTCCAGACINTQTDRANCGMCGAACNPANSTGACVAGACTVGACNTGFGNCDGMNANGCETNLTSNTNNCGRCMTACSGGPNATPRCAAGACTLVCNPGTGNCDAMGANGCETNTNTNVMNCGTCGRACALTAMQVNATASCGNGTCGFTCATGFGNCDGNANNACETNLTNTASHCGACGRVCNLPNATAACAMGACSVGTCNAGFGNCDANNANGCETPTGNDRNNCGMCGRRCAANEVCFSGACRALCTAPAAVCGTACVDLQTDNANCGACGRRCTAPANATSACTMGACAVTCSRGFGNCDSMAANGCEQNLTNSTANCGACGTRCTFANAAAACNNGACERGACNAGFADCDGAPSNGCETATATNLNNCGACGRVCSFANAAATCANGACAMGACNAGWADCNRNPADGCETNTNASSLNCGACGRTCAAGTACSAGACVTSCPTGTSFCAGVCVNFQSDRNNCGACGRVCPNGQFCSLGVCRVNVPANDLRANATPINLSTPTVEFSGTTLGAGNESGQAPCLAGAAGRGADVFYTFTLTRREYIYADAVALATLPTGLRNDPVLYLTNAMGTAVDTQTTADVVCNDDINACGSTVASRIYTVLPAGTYYLVLAGWNTDVGAATIHFEHVPAGNGTTTVLPQGMSTQSGRVTGTGGASTGTCGGAGPENSYWWVTCPNTGGGTLTADTCGTASFDTVLSIYNGNGFTACNDNGGGTCDVQSRLSAAYSAASRLRALLVDSFTSGASGAYTLRVNRP